MRSKLSEGSRYALTVRYAVALPAGGKCLPQGVDRTLVEGIILFRSEDRSRNRLQKSVRST